MPDLLLGAVTLACVGDGSLSDKNAADDVHIAGIDFCALRSLTVTDSRSAATSMCLRFANCPEKSYRESRVAGA